MTDDASAWHTPAAVPTRWRRFLTSTKRGVTLSVAATSVYLLIGCWMFPIWWYHWLWQGGFADPEYSVEGLHALLGNYFWLVFGVILLILAAVLLKRIFRSFLFRIVDTFAGIIVFASALAIAVAFLLLYHAYHSDKPDPMDEIAELSGRVQSQLAMIYTSPVIVPPIDFDYISKERVDALYNQLEPELEEKERTVAQGTTAQAKGGVAAGGISAEVSEGKSGSSTSSFSRTRFSEERECVEIMKYAADKYSYARYFSTSEHWMQTRRGAEGVLSEQQTEQAAILNRFRTTLGADPLPPAKMPTEAEREAKREHDLSNELRDLQGLVFLDGAFSKSITHDEMILLEKFSTGPRPVYFRVHIPKSGKADIPARGVMRVFGDVLRPLDADGYVDIRAIAVY